MEALRYMVWVLNILEIAACITGFIYFKKLKNTYWRWLPFYLLFIICVEFTGRYFADTNQLMNNILLYKYIGFPVQFLFFYFIFFQHEYFSNKKRLILVGAGIYLASIVVEIIFFSDKYYWFHSFSYSIGNIILLILVLIFFLAFIQSKEILNFSKTLMFWFCLGLFIYYLGSFPYWGLRNVLAVKYRNIFETYTLISLALGYCMYLLFITGIVRCKLK